MESALLERLRRRVGVGTGTEVRIRELQRRAVDRNLRVHKIGGATYEVVELRTGEVVSTGTLDEIEAVVSDTWQGATTSRVNGTGPDRPARLEGSLGAAPPAGAATLRDGLRRLGEWLLQQPA